MVHGGPGIPHDYLLPSMVELADRDDRPVILYDQLGCGRSERPTDDALWSVARFRGELAGVVSALQLDSFHLWGHSWGAQLALNYAAARPAGLLSVTLAGPVLDIPAYRRDLEELLGQQPEDVQEALRNSPIGSPEYERAKAAFYGTHLHSSVPLPESWRAATSPHRFGSRSYEAMVGPDEFNYTGALRDVDDSHLLPLVDAPVSLHCGRADIATPRRCQRYRALTPGAEVKVFEHSSHAFFDEERPLYVKTLRDFLRRHDGDLVAVPWRRSHARTLTAGLQW